MGSSLFCFSSFYMAYFRLCKMKQPRKFTKSFRFHSTSQTIKYTSNTHEEGKNTRKCFFFRFFSTDMFMLKSDVCHFGAIHNVRQFGKHSMGPFFVGVCTCVCFCVVHISTTAATAVVEAAAFLSGVM